MADRKSVWLYIYAERNDFDGPAFLVYAKKADAYAHAAQTIKGIAEPERTRYDWEEDDTNLDELAEILQTIAEGKHEDALALWDHYSQEYDHDERVDVQEVQYFE
jgi:hypothetical protein